MSTIAENSQPTIVYKYRSLTADYHLDILAKNQVYLSSPERFNDPFDCRIYANFSLLDTAEKKQRYARELVEMNMSVILQRKENPEDKFSEVMQELLTDMDSYQTRAEQAHFSLQNERIGVLSLSEIWNNILMWSHYSDNHKGFCVGLHENKLRESGLFGRGGRVQYVKDYPELYPTYSYLKDEEETLRRFFTVTHYKSIDWKYEKEYRVTTTFHLGSDDERVVTLPDECYAEIVLGAHFPDESIPAFIGAAKSRNIPLYKAIKVPFKFAVDRIRIF